MITHLLMGSCSIGNIKSLSYIFNIYQQSESDILKYKLTLINCLEVGFIYLDVIIFLLNKGLLVKDTDLWYWLKDENMDEPQYVLDIINTVFVDYNQKDALEKVNDNVEGITQYVNYLLNGGKRIDSFKVVKKLFTYTTF